MPPLVKPPLPPVAAGQPITAQGWNVILGALDDLFDGINAFGSLSLAVTLTASGAPLKNAVVVAVPGSGQPVTAAPPYASTNAFTFTNLTPGPWTIHAMAPNFAPATHVISNLTASGAISIALTPDNTVVVPNLIGFLGPTAVSSLGTLGIAIALIIDVDGDDVSSTSYPNSHTGSRVIGQFPVPGSRVVAASAGMRLILSTARVKTGEIFEIPKHIRDAVILVGGFNVGSPGGGGTSPTVERPPAIEAAPRDGAAPADGGLRVFISPEERPAVGADALRQPRDG